MSLDYEQQRGCQKRDLAELHSADEVQDSIEALEEKVTFPITFKHSLLVYLNQRKNINNYVIIGLTVEEI